MVAVVCRCGLAGGWLQLVSRARASARGSGEVASCEETGLFIVQQLSAGGDSATPRVEMCGGGDDVESGREWPMAGGARGGRSVGDASGGCRAVRVFLLLPPSKQILIYRTVHYYLWI